jgi:hypothetical protein
VTPCQRDSAGPISAVRPGCQGPTSGSGSDNLPVTPAGCPAPRDPFAMGERQTPDSISRTRRARQVGGNYDASPRPRREITRAPTNGGEGGHAAPLGPQDAGSFVAGDFGPPLANASPLVTLGAGVHMVEGSRKAKPPCGITLECSRRAGVGRESQRRWSRLDLGVVLPERFPGFGGGPQLIRMLAGSSSHGQIRHGAPRPDAASLLRRSFASSSSRPPLSRVGRGNMVVPVTQRVRGITSHGVRCQPRCNC